MPDGVPNQLPQTGLWKVVIYEAERFVRTDRDNITYGIKAIGRSFEWPFRPKAKGKRGGAMSEVEQRQRKALAMGLAIMAGDYELLEVSQLDDERPESRDYVLRCKECEQSISVPLLQGLDDVWGSVVQMKIMQHREAAH
jgi:hypothetical protein